MDLTVTLLFRPH